MNTKSPRGCQIMRGILRIQVAVRRPTHLPSPANDVKLGRVRGAHPRRIETKPRPSYPLTYYGPVSRRPGSRARVKKENIPPRSSVRTFARLRYARSKNICVARYEGISRRQDSRCQIFSQLFTYSVKAGGNAKKFAYKVLKVSVGFLI